MLMLRMICGKIRDGISNETIREMTGVEKINLGVVENAEVAMVWAHKKG